MHFLAIHEERQGGGYIESLCADGPSTMMGYSLKIREIDFVNRPRFVTRIDQVLTNRHEIWAGGNMQDANNRPFFSALPFLPLFSFEGSVRFPEYWSNARGTPSRSTAADV
jgi:hypothetical protein